MMLNFHRGDPVYTADDDHLGIAHVLYHRLSEVRPEWQFYAAYLYVISFELGGDYYIPTDFIAGRDTTTGRITLKVKRREVEKRTWQRMPEFIILNQSRREELPELTAAG